MYARYLRALLAPIGLYDLSAGTHNAAAISALGSALDAVEEKLDTALREGVLATAEDAGLEAWESLVARRPAASTAQGRRAALEALLRVREGSGSAAEINGTLRGCGVPALAQERGVGSIRVTFPNVVGVPADFEKIRPILLDILPCHAEVEIYFRYLLWSECEALGYTWAQIETARYTWEQFQCAVPEEA